MGVTEFTEEQIVARHHAFDSTHQFASKVLVAVYRDGARPTLDLDEIVECIAAEHGITRKDIMGARRTKNIAHARKALYAALRATGMSYPEIGAFVGGRDHTTVMAGVRAFQREHGQ